MQNGLDQVRAAVESLPMMLKSFATWAYIYVAQPLVDAKEGRRVCWTVAALNTGIWVLWQIPRLRPIMRASFSHNPLSGKSYTMLTSTFSHKSFFHLLFNSMALTSFGTSEGPLISFRPYAQVIGHRLCHMRISDPRAGK